MICINSDQHMNSSAKTKKKLNICDRYEPNRRPLIFSFYFSSVLWVINAKRERYNRIWRQRRMLAFLFGGWVITQLDFINTNPAQELIENWWTAANRSSNVVRYNSMLAKFSQKHILCCHKLTEVRESQILEMEMELQVQLSRQWPKVSMFAETGCGAAALNTLGGGSAWALGASSAASAADDLV